jgi:hypothetical protein
MSGLEHCAQHHTPIYDAEEFSILVVQCQAVSPLSTSRLWFDTLNSLVGLLEADPLHLEV